MNIRFRHLSISDEKNYISGIALCYNTMIEANVLFDVLYECFEGNVSEKISIKFYKNKFSMYNMSLLIRESKNLYRIELEGIKNIYIEKLERSLKENGYIFIVTAQSNIVSEFKLNKQKYCCVSEFYIDNKKVEGNKRKNNFVKELVEQFVNN